MPTCEERQQFIEVFRSRRHLSGAAFMHVMQPKPQMAPVIRRPQIRECVVRVEQADDALGSMRGNQPCDSGKG